MVTDGQIKVFADWLYCNGWLYYIIKEIDGLSINHALATCERVFPLLYLEGLITAQQEQVFLVSWHEYYKEDK